jgi:hypothetical protein
VLVEEQWGRTNFGAFFDEVVLMLTRRHFLEFEGLG